MSPFPRSLEAGHLWQCRPPVLGCAWPKERRPCSLKNLLDGFPHRTKCTGCCSTPASDSYLFADVPEGSGRSGRSCLFNLPAPRSLSLSSCDVAFTLGTLICFENEQDQLPRAVVKRKLENVCENTFLPKCLLFLSHWCLTNVSCSALWLYWGVFPFQNPASRIWLYFRIRIVWLLFEAIVLNVCGEYGAFCSLFFLEQMQSTLMHGTGRFNEM